MSVVGYADDVVVIVTVHNTSLVEEVLNLALELVARWFAHNGLGLVAEKTVAVMLTRKWGYSSPLGHIGGHRVPFERTIRHIGVPLET